MLTDSEIAGLLAEPKALTEKGIRRLKNPKRLVSRSRRSVVRCKGESGKLFSIMASLGPNVRFSVHVRYHLSGKRIPITLIRCNGPHGPHVNVLERTRIPARVCHIHLLTERYQHAGPQRKSLTYAEQTGEYRSFATAVDHVCNSYGFYFEDHDNNYPLLPE